MLNILVNVYESEKDFGKIVNTPYKIVFFIYLYDFFKKIKKYEKEYKKVNQLLNMTPAKHTKKELVNEAKKMEIKNPFFF